MYFPPERVSQGVVLNNLYSLPKCFNYHPLLRYPYLRLEIHSCTLEMVSPCLVTKENPSNPILSLQIPPKMHRIEICQVISSGVPPRVVFPSLISDPFSPFRLAGTTLGRPSSRRRGDSTKWNMRWRRSHMPEHVWEFSPKMVSCWPLNVATQTNCWTRVSLPRRSTS